MAIKNSDIKSAGVAVTTTRQTAYTAGGLGAKMYVDVGNIDGAAAAGLTLEIYDSNAGTRKKVLDAFSIDQNDGIKLGPFYLETSDRIELTASADNDLEAQVHGVEFS